MPVRKNPLQERGPKPPCENCPEDEDYKNLKGNRQSKLEPALLTYDSQGRRLWNHVLYGTSSCLGMVEGYFDMGMPNIPVDQVVHLRDRLNRILEKVQRQKDDESQDTKIV